MMKLSLLLTAFFTLAACQTTPVTNPTPDPSSSPSPAPSASATPVPNGRYALPVTLSLAPECTEGDTPITQYEIKADGTFRYPTNSEPANLFEEPGVLPLSSATLTEAQLNDFKATLATQDLANAFAETTPVPPGSPQTTECRTVSILNMPVDGDVQNYALNGRERNTTENYRTRWQAIRAQFEALAASVRMNTAPIPPDPIPTEPEYAFPPLTFNVDRECGLGTFTRYEITGFNQFIVYAEDGSKTSERMLTSEEQQALRAALENADLNARLENSEPVPADAPQTRECRSVDKLTFPVFGVPKTFDRNGRSFRHTQEYVDGFNQIKTTLEGFAGA